MIEASLWETAIELQSYLESCDYSFCIIEGIAIQRWGELRLTRDVDATLAIPFGSERRVAGEILKRYQSRISNPIDFAVQARILLLQDLTGNGIDLALGGMPYEQRLMDRSSMWGTTSNSLHQEPRTKNQTRLFQLPQLAPHATFAPSAT